MKFGVNVVIIRTGIVLGNGGILEKLMKPIKFGFAAYSKDQWLSWIHINDFSRMIEFIIDKSLNGTFNATSPQPVKMEDFLTLLAHTVKKKRLLKIPDFIVKLALGDMADYLLFSSQKVLPKAAMSMGFEFEYPNIEKAIESIFNKRM